jgi:hypothetical protein
VAHRRGDGSVTRHQRVSGLGQDDGVVGATAAGASRGAVGAAVRAWLSGRAARCPNSGLKACAIRAARGSHAATARCRAGPARRAASDRWGPLSAISELKIIAKK